MSKKWEIGAVVALGVLVVLILNWRSIFPTSPAAIGVQPIRERVLLDSGWRFMKYKNAADADDLIYDIRPSHIDYQDGKPADAEPTDAVSLESSTAVLKPWILPTANAFIADADKHHVRPAGSPGADFAFVQSGFDDSNWQPVTLPHDWAIQGPFFAGPDAEVGGGMGRLPSPGVAWYRNKFDIPVTDHNKAIYLDVDGAMSYAMVWLNGALVGGWPYGYTSFRLDLTPYVEYGKTNQLAIRLDNPPASSRWYPGGGLYRNVWLTKLSKFHVSHWGTQITTERVTEGTAELELKIGIANRSSQDGTVDLVTEIYEVGADDKAVGKPVAVLSEKGVSVPSANKVTLSQTAFIANAKLWGPLPTQTPHRYMALVNVSQGKTILDQQTTFFGIRTLEFNADMGLMVNGEHVYLQGVNQHHDLGALGAAFNVRAAQRQLQLLQEMGTNAIRMAHNPPATELLYLADKMGILVVDEIFDSWQRKKTPLDFHLIFDDWSEPDLRAMIRRDYNHPSVFMWSIGNEVGEQYTEEAGAAVGKRLHDIVKSEDPTRPTAASMNYAKAHMPFAAVMDTISLNYQGEGIRNAPAYKHLQGIRTPPNYPDFHKAYPDKLIFSSENAAAVSSRGEYMFPVAEGISAPIADGMGGNPESAQVSSYELYTAPFGSSADKVFLSMQLHPFVAGGFVWSGWDYLGEPTPYYSARSSYFGVIDLAGFKKDRFYLYQSHWRPDFPMAHILPHWNWPERIGLVTPVHVFTSGDSAELFLNGESLGLKHKTKYESRLRWDDVLYQPGVLEVVAYKKGVEWARDTVKTTGPGAAVQLSVDRNLIDANGKDLAFVTAKIVDAEGNFVANANDMLQFSVEGSGKLLATDNGDPTNLTEFQSSQRAAFNGLALAIVRGNAHSAGEITVRVSAEGISSDSLTIETFR